MMMMLSLYISIQHYYYIIMHINGHWLSEKRSHATVRFFRRRSGARRLDADDYYTDATRPKARKNFSLILMIATGPAIASDPPELALDRPSS